MTESTTLDVASEIGCFNIDKALYFFQLGRECVLLFFSIVNLTTMSTRILREQQIDFFFPMNYFTMATTAANVGTTAASTTPKSTHKHGDDADLLAPYARLRPQRRWWRFLASLLILHHSSLAAAHRVLHSRVHRMSAKSSYKPPWPPPAKPPWPPPSPWAPISPTATTAPSRATAREGLLPTVIDELEESLIGSSEKFSQDCEVFGFRDLKAPGIRHLIQSWVASQPLNSGIADRVCMAKAK